MLKPPKHHNFGQKSIKPQICVSNTLLNLIYYPQNQNFFCTLLLGLLCLHRMTELSQQRLRPARASKLSNKRNLFHFSWKYLQTVFWKAPQHLTLKSAGVFFAKSWHPDPLVPSVSQWELFICLECFNFGPPCVYSDRQCPARSANISLSGKENAEARKKPARCNGSGRFWRKTGCFSKITRNDVTPLERRVL